jgi:hypothetical protein
VFLLIRRLTHHCTSGIAAQSRDLLTTIKRYYSNSFTDSEKQQAMNLFLGRFVPSPNARDIWDLEHDWQLHNRVQFVEHRLLTIEQWWSEPLAAFETALGALRSAPKPPPLYAASLASAALALASPLPTSSPSALALLPLASHSDSSSSSSNATRAVQARLRRRRRSVLEMIVVFLCFASRVTDSLRCVGSRGTVAASV